MSEFSCVPSVLRTATAMSLMIGMLMSITPAIASAATLEEQTKNLEVTVKTVEQRRKDALHDLNENVLQAFRNAIQIESVDTDIAEVFDQTAQVRVVVSYTVSFEAAKAVRSSLSQYFTTSTDKVPGVEPYGRIYTKFDTCVGINCTIQKETSRYLQSSAVGIKVSFLGQWQSGVIADLSGHYELMPGTFTFLFDVPKSKIKGDPKPVVKGQIYGQHLCSSRDECTGWFYLPR